MICLSPSAKSEPSCEMWEAEGESTCYEVRQIVIDVHEAVGTGVGHATVRVSNQLFPGRLCHHYIIILQPAFLSVIINIGPVMSSRGLSFMDKHSVQPIGHLGASNKSHANFLKRLSQYKSSSECWRYRLYLTQTVIWVHALQGLADLVNAGFQLCTQRGNTDQYTAPEAWILIQSLTH